MSRGRRFRAARVAAAAVLLTVGLVPSLAGRATGAESLTELKARMANLQAELDAAGAQIENLRTQLEVVQHDIETGQARVKKLTKGVAKLQTRTVELANILYRSGGSGILEVLIGSQDLAELADKAEMLSQVSLDDSRAFVDLDRKVLALDKETAQLKIRRADLVATQDALADRVSSLQALFQAKAGEYNALKQKLAAAAAAAPPAPTTSTSVRLRTASGMACPVAGPVSFSDTWGAPRAGHTHQGVDMMAAYGTPVAAITSGTITLSSYGSSAGYWQILSGDDGNQYWYMHNQRNIVNGGHVSAGQQIATVGDTGNASGTPHLHFEFHPGGGGAVNPTPLVSSVC